MIARCFLALSSRRFSVKSGGNIIKSPFKNVDLPRITVPEYVWRNLDKWPDHTATVCGVTGRKYTYSQLRTLSATFGSNLRRKLKLRDGDCVAIMMPNLPEFPGVVLGASEAGCIVTTLNHIYTPYEIRKQIKLSEAKAIITTDTLYPVVKEALEEVDQNLPIITVKLNENASTYDKAIDFKELAQDPNVDLSNLKDVRRTPDDVIAVPYSSGTTGMPKGVELTNFNLVSNCQQIDGEEIKHQEETTATHQDALVLVLPMFHIYGFTILMLHKLSVGCKLVTLAKFELQNFIKALNEHQVSMLYAAPPMVLALATNPIVESKHLQNIRTIMAGAAPTPLCDAENLLKKTKKDCRFLQGYGMTETSPLATMMANNEVNHTSVGYAIPNSELLLIDENGNGLEPGKVGELLFRGPNVMKGYKNNPEATRESITPEGWYRSGDLAYHDDKGAIYIADRLKELIKVKGFQVPPAELESVLREHPAVADAVVVGVAHERTGEAPKAFVVTKPGVQTTPKEIMHFVATRVAPYKKLIDLQFIDSIPKSASGKILRREVKEKFCS